ncbi:MAG: cysteine-rich CWC family protein [Chlorobiaceae bacterium]|nr:cysteine-rich CWC family protein [Chlorobiaceae bacterium]
MHSPEQSPAAGTTVNCPICGDTFNCTLTATCWCARKVVPEDVRYFLASRYDTCVCSSCLDRLIRKSNTGQSLEM